jgi:hypothetical protein
MSRAQEGEHRRLVAGCAGMSPGDELAREVLRDRVPLDEAGEQPLAEQLHHGFWVPALERVKGAVCGEGPIRGQAAASTIGRPATHPVVRSRRS